MELTDEAGNPLQPKVVTLEEIEAKETWHEEDIELLVAHVDALQDETLERLGLVEVEPKTPEEVAAETAILKKSKRVVKKAVKKVAKAEK